MSSSILNQIATRFQTCAVFSLRGALRSFSFRTTKWNFGTLDVVLGHCRRYSKESLRQAAEDAGFVVKDIFEFNRIGTPAWFLNGKILRRHTFGLFQIWMLDMLTPLFRRIDWLLPFPGLSLIAVLERRDAYQEEALSAFGNCVPAR